MRALLLAMTVPQLVNGGNPHKRANQLQCAAKKCSVVEQSGGVLPQHGSQPQKGTKAQKKIFVLFVPFVAE